MTDKNIPLKAALAQAPRKLKLAIGIVLLATFVVPLVLSADNHSTTQLLLAMVLLDVCLYPTLHYFLRKQGLPVLPVLCLAFAVQYALPIFTQDPVIELAYGLRYLDEGDIVAALALAILGVCALQVAYYSLNYRKSVTLVPRITLQLDQRRAVIFCVSVFLLSFLLNRVATAMLSEETYLQFSSVIGLLQNQLLVAIGILGWLVFTERGNQWHKILLYGVVAVASARGFTNTMMETMMAPLAVLFMSKWFYTKRLPVSMLIVIAVFFLFLSPVKKNIRSAIIQDRSTASEISTTDRATDWVSQAISYWGESFSGRRDLAESTSDASTRTDLIHSLAHIYALTPAVVPYQYGDTYGYLAVAWIPRMIWPEKPVANQANNFFAVAYEVSTEEGVKTSTFGATLMGEGFMNFGVAGLIFVMLFLGLVTSLLEDIFAGRESGPGGRAIFLAIFVFFLNGIGSSGEMMFGGLVQNLLASWILLWWVRERKPNRRQSPVRRLLLTPES